jgi:glycogen operon protein
MQDTARRLGSGHVSAIGATVEPGGVNFALFSRNADQVFLLLFDAVEENPTDIIELVKDEDSGIWHIFVNDAEPGQFYGYRVAGPYDPARGLRFNPHKLLMDPYARALTGKFRDREGLLYGYDLFDSRGDLTPDRRDNATLVPKCVVMDDGFDWGDDRAPAIPREDTIVYEVHLRGFTAHPSSGVKYPGTYLGFIEKIPYLQKLGVTTVELMPVQEFHIRDELLRLGLTEYWGYNTIGFFAPESSYGTGTYPGCQVAEFKTLVRELHRAGLEVILDVVYNHTGEEDELGPTLCFRGIDNSSYYALEGPEEQPARFYRDITGCRNTLDIEKQPVLRLVLDSLRYWVREMHVDGFRFDLATVLARKKSSFTQDAEFLHAVGSDPVLKEVKLIAEPWDPTMRGTGSFPGDWMEWNDAFRDGMRRYLRGDGDLIGPVATRLAGSQDIFGGPGRSPCSGVNFVTAHDGFTLRDLYTYEQKRNEANGENNRDGTENNNGFNCGVEGETDDAAVNELRLRMVKNCLCMLFLSRGIPMLLSGDEMYRTQSGNNNCYCQDGEISWFHWDQTHVQADLLGFTQRLIGLRRRFPVLRRCRFFDGGEGRAAGEPDIRWFGPGLEPPNWNDGESRLLCCELVGTDAQDEEQDGLGPYHLFMIFNMDDEEAEVLLPQQEGRSWYRVIDTGRADEDEARLDPADRYTARGRSVVLLLAR